MDRVFLWEMSQIRRRELLDMARIPAFRRGARPKGDIVTALWSKFTPWRRSAGHRSAQSLRIRLADRDTADHAAGRKLGLPIR